MRITSGLISVLITIAVGCTVLDEVNRSLVGWTPDIRKPHRQTYIEYVQERLEVERLMK